jgi:hypothetical protein
MAFPRGCAKDEKPATDFRSISDADFARLSTEDKFRHIHLGMVQLSQTLAELAPAISRGRSNGK